MPETAGGASRPGPVPSPSRVRDALLGGRRNLQCDRDLAARLERMFPGIGADTADVRAFTARAAGWCASRGIGQYIIAEPGLPLPGGAGDAARAVLPAARLAYAVADSSEAAYARAAAAGDPAGTAAVCGAGAESAAVLLADPGLRAVIRLGEPACAVLPAVSLMDAAGAEAMITGFGAALVPGSALVISAWAPGPGEAAEALAAAAAPAGCLFPHDAGSLEKWLGAGRLRLVDPPGVTGARWWRAGMDCPVRGGTARITAAAGAVALVT